MAEDQKLPRPTRQRRAIEEPEGVFKPARRPVSQFDGNPLIDSRSRMERSGGLEFEAWQIVEIREKFHATQRRFAQMFGISVKTLRNWEQGRRKPVGPARALLRVAKANPEAVARVLWRYRRAWWMD
jgi:DNA-binding transcriptional regulator YiaG